MGLGELSGNTVHAVSALSFLSASLPLLTLLDPFSEDYPSPHNYSLAASLLYCVFCIYLTMEQVPLPLSHFVGPILNILGDILLFAIYVYTILCLSEMERGNPNISTSWTTLIIS